MKLTKKLEAEILKVYNAYWKGYLKGDVKGMSSLLVDDYTQVGSAETEVFDTKKAAVKFLRDTIDQVAGKLEMRNRITTIEAQGNLILVHEVCDVYVLADGEWIFYSKFRASTLMQKKKQGWKIAHQHSSFPDARAGEGENIATDKIAEENRQLREAVKRRTIELENKNRALEIETALEKVRTVALSMKEPADMPEVCKTISLQMQSLGVKEIRNVQTAIFYESRGTYMNYEYYAKHKKTTVTETSYTNHKVHKAFAAKMLKGKGEVFITHIKGKKVKDWIAYQKTTNVFIDRFLEEANSLNYYWHSLGPVALGISTYLPLSKEELSLFGRFLNVFELAYTRYLDIEQAHAQARESQIQASLEKVRAQALGMRKPEDLPDVCEVLFKELQALGFNELRNAMVNIHNDDKRTFLNYDYSNEIGKSITPLHYDIHPVIKRQVQQIRSARDAFSETVFTGKDLVEWKQFRRRSGEKDDPRIKHIAALHYYLYSIGTGSIGISTFSSIGEEKLEVLKRFRNVFDFAYRRYMDVAQAETQAKEARIEAALERVRAQAMSMRKSEELLNVCESVFRQLQTLGFSDDILRNSQIVINQDEKGFYHGYQYSDYAGAEFAVVPYDLHPVIKFLSDKLRQSSEAFADIAITGQSLDDWKSFVNSFPQKHDDKLNAASELHYYFYSVGIGALGISTFESITEQQLEILKRFRNVFDLSYKRYTDIALAEAQAREAQIQLALERVRARTMAMQKSDELAETAAVLFQQFKEIDKAPKMLTIGIMNEKEGLIEFWVTDWSGGGSKVNRKFDASIEEPVLLNKIFAAWKEQRKSTVIELVGKKLQDWIDYRVRLSGIPDDNDYSSRGGFVIAAFFSKGMLSISAYEPRPPETVQLLERFAGVFDLTYTRFLDLQKAEAQARESQIQLALERVRARTMAMQHSDELKDAAILLFQQIKTLGVKTGSCGFNIWEKNEKAATVWVSSPEGGLQTPFKMLHTESAIYKDVYSSMKNGTDFLVKEVGGKVLKRHFDYLLSVPVIGDVIKNLRETGYQFPETLIYHFSFFNHGYLSFHTHEPCPEAHDIFKRFATMFEQTYTRFLDLQKAEAQAREAQIEVALERIRARAMAMHASDELMDVARILREQMGLLGQPELETSVINLFEENSDQVLSWHAFRSPELSSGKIITGAASFRWDSNAISREMMEVYRSGQQEYTMEADGAMAMELIRVLVTAAPEIARYVGESIPERVCYHLSYFSGGALLMVSYQPPSEEARSLQRRAASVFDMAYRRYCDLKKAEAQTREATIEASLEKVRGKAMAMHTSSDISETMGVVFSELPKLGIGSLRCGVALLSKDSRRVIFYAAADALESDSLTLIGTGEMSGHPEFENQYECWLKQENYFVTLSDEALRSYYEALAARLSAPYTPREHREQTEHGYYFPFSTGNFYAWSEKPYSESEIDILQRFKAIIDLTFRRYLDLKQAEVQTREAQIETSLERVRSRTLAMQKSDELAETAAVLFRQLITLGIAPNRLYIAIMKDERGNAEFWITDEDGSKVSTGFSANLRGNGSFQKMLTGWQEGTKSITIDMQGKELQEYFQHLSSLSVPFKGGLSQTRRVQNIAYFSRGFIGMASPDTQPEETTTLLERFAAVFNLTLTRFNDLKLAEAQAHQAHLDLIQLQAEKKRAEDALSELSATQAQLVQQEKLASLGQLTAGIAHEIKNPLNFVNNFSSVSVELVDEAIEEIKKFSGNGGDARQLLDDVKKNLNKIIEHGTRADGIVKSMLQHSRGGSGKKEPTDLNALVKEYVNLAFHGMRASKNPINVDIVLDLHDSIGKVPVIAEDFSRVIINLCQNAFDAMREKVNAGDKKSGSYLPKLTVRTRREADKIIVEVGDNGPGIPDAIKDKILQPFFTTKKGTQGTGLGLSITHDIVKAHAGEMNIETNGNGGATFIVRLPP